MKRLFLILIFIPLLSNAQQLQQSVFVAAPSYSLFNSSNSTAPPASKKGALGVGAGYGIDYYFPKTLSLGSSIEYSFTRGKFYTDCYCFYIGNRILIRNNISIHSFDIPLYLNVRTNKKENQFLYFKSGIGSSILINARRVVEREVNHLNESSPERTEIHSGTFKLKSQNNTVFGSFFLIATGYSYSIKNINLYSELSFKQDINSWDYHTVKTPDGSKQVPFKRQVFTLKTGILF